jgi:hypothetical protein
MGFGLPAIERLWLRQFSHAKPEEHAVDFMVRRGARSRASIFVVVCDPDEERKCDGL